MYACSIYIYTISTVTDDNGDDDDGGDVDDEKHMM